jgi:malate/lactate dehydrogenase
LINEKLKRDGVYSFAQSVLKILRLWNISKSDDCQYSAIVNVNGCYGVNDDVYLSVPVKFENGSFKISDSYFESNNTLVAEIAEVRCIFFVKN